MMSRRFGGGYLALFLMAGMVLAFAFVSVEAASFDGTYNYVYTLNGPNGKETHRVDSGFIVSGGRISSNPSALSGSVDSGGTVSFTGPSPYGSPSAAFTGSIKSDGIGGGNYRDSQGLDGTWSVVRVSGGSSGSGGSGIIGIVEAVLNFMYSFSFIGEAIGLSGTLAASVGTAAVILVFVIGITAVTSAGSRRRKSGVMQRKRGEGGRIISKVNYDLDRQGEYEVSPGESSGTHEIPVSSIDVPPGPFHPPVGLHVERPALPDRFDLFGVIMGSDLIGRRPILTRRSLS